MGKIIMTPEGYRDLQNKLSVLKSALRNEIPGMLSAAREQGDLSENAEYDAALAMQHDYERRAQELEEILKNAEIVEDNDQSPGQVGLGTTVVIRLLDEDEFDEAFRIVGTTEADSLNGAISNECPVVKAITKAKASVGDIVYVKAPGGTFRYKIKEIKKTA